jgi:4-O-beta-D-mannosyl-D-glucose phosphorylase
MTREFEQRLSALENAYHKLITMPNKIAGIGNGIYDRYINPVLTAAHAPVFWKYDLNPKTNPYLMERFGINAAFNAGAIKWKDKYLLMARVEGTDRKSFFAIAESPNGVDNFAFWDNPVVMPETDEPDTNIYDPRLTAHEDGWIYSIFCTERRDPQAPGYDQSMAVAACGIARSKDLIKWDRLPDLKTPSAQQRNVVLHPEFVKGKYGFYTRPQDSFINAGKGGGIGFGVCDDITNAVIDHEDIIDNKIYHTVYEAKNGQGPTPIKTEYGWLHLAHGVRNTAAGLRYVLYVFMTDLDDLTKVIYKPGGYFVAPEGDERFGDVPNVAFCNGWIMDDDGTVYIYYASADSRMHVATSTLPKLLDYTMNTPADGFRSAASVDTLNKIITANNSLLAQEKKV